MGKHLGLLEFQIALLELQEVNMNPDSIHIPGYVRRGGWSGVYTERERSRRIRNREWLRHRIKHLKKQHYIEIKREGDRQLLKLTAKGKYEVLRLRFLLQIRARRQKRWDGKLWIAMYDVPEVKRAHRAFFRKLLKQAGFVMLQRSIWVSRYNPHPEVDELLKYLQIEKCFELLEVECKKCSPRFQRRVGKRFFGRWAK